ncbi:MAG: deoxyribodipyrimidine photo-lyase [Woeseiaceae bacterium]|nr:deoxyribodipyrimidine photo-lyase [Woeseiaceae bacterium]
MRPVLYWFRRDLRLADNRALSAAVETGSPVIPVYIVDSQDVGGASRWWLHNSLDALGREIKSRGGELVLREGSPERHLLELKEETGALAVYCQERYEPESRAQASRLAESIDLHAFDDNLAARPTALTTQSGTYFRVFTPFWKTATALGTPDLPLPVPAQLRFADCRPHSVPLDDLALHPNRPDWSGGLRASWSPGEAGAADLADRLESKLADYAQGRDRPDLDVTSRLSPHLHFGEISCRQVWHTVKQMELHARSTAGAEALLRQLYWREFSAYLLYHYPQLPTSPLRPEFEYFPWSDNAEHLQAWQTGRTGFPIVDAGMRQLWQTGWMHNRVRMIVASFLVKDLMIPWQRGAEWFLDTLVDADLANNSASWQWVAGCGTDAAPYFRIFNPSLQAEKFDPNGDYVRRWVPELAQKTATGYPDPIVDHRVARQRALEAYDSIKGIRTSRSVPQPGESSNRNDPPCAVATNAAK